MVVLVIIQLRLPLHGGLLFSSELASVLISRSLWMSQTLTIPIVFMCTSLSFSEDMFVLESDTVAVGEVVLAIIQLRLPLHRGSLFSFYSGPVGISHSSRMSQSLTESDNRSRLAEVVILALSVQSWLPLYTVNYCPCPTLNRYVFSFLSNLNSDQIQCSAF